MKSFKDNEGREWLLAINVAQVKRVRDLLGVDLPGLLDDNLSGLAKLLSDPAGLVDVAYVLCRDQTEKRGLSDWDFGSSLGGDSILGIRDAFLAELVDFFPDPRVRGALTKLIEASRRLQDGVIGRMGPALDSIDLEAEVDRLIASFGGAPGSSGSTPARSPSANSP